MIGCDTNYDHACGKLLLQIRKFTLLSELLQIGNRIIKTIPTKLPFRLFIRKKNCIGGKSYFFRGAIIIKFLKNIIEIHFHGVIIKYKPITYFPSSWSDAS